MIHEALDAAGLACVPYEDMQDTSCGYDYQDEEKILKHADDLRN